ncbi:hypothetical protein, variant 1 [Aphanomyces astaci]|uniref:Uncharacterized protein n=1 Tax=Aphanomyces astaci TaxID=112090 RepID=W4GAN7_APHAT|nr:hypothetical protein, variant 1 [Aphanomyces astaci]ETV76730.1 hypothetical protein, variant 1 [Aphanomyces astaci]|eukprot:XP_009833641.1 hypothetical protein, variant 1 [Aphanomyces astaci]
MSSSSEEDVPLSQLRVAQNQRRDVDVKRDVKETKKDATKEVQQPATKLAGPPKRVLDDSDDEMPLLAMKKSKVKKESAHIDDDDKPIKKKVSSVSVKREAKSDSPVKLEKRTISTSSKQRKAKSIAYKQQEASESLYDTLKGRLVQELLCRWWYALDWPSHDTKREETPDLQPLDGFPGSFISVKGDDMGSIVDKRNASGKPTFITFFAMPSKEVQNLLVVAYANQMKVLAKHEGPDAPLLKDLGQALKSAQSINADKAERESIKALKEYVELAARLKELRE